MTTGAPLTTGPFVGRRTYPLAHVVNVETGTSTARAASASVYSGVVNRRWCGLGTTDGRLRSAPPLQRASSRYRCGTARPLRTTSIVAELSGEGWTTPAAATLGEEAMLDMVGCAPAMDEPADALELDFEDDADDG